jgi:hypothetical protein
MDFGRYWGTSTKRLLSAMARHEWRFRSGLRGAALYARVSTNNGQNPQMQLGEMREHATRRGWEVSEYTDAGRLRTKRRIYRSLGIERKLSRPRSAVTPPDFAYIHRALLQSDRRRAV